MEDLKSKERAFFKEAERLGIKDDVVFMMKHELVFYEDFKSNDERHSYAKAVVFGLFTSAGMYHHDAETLMGVKEEAFKKLDSLLSA